MHVAAGNLTLARMWATRYAHQAAVCTAAQAPHGCPSTQASSARAPKAQPAVVTFWTRAHRQANSAMTRYCVGRQQYSMPLLPHVLSVRPQPIVLSVAPCARRRHRRHGTCATGPHQTPSGSSHGPVYWIPYRPLPSRQSCSRIALTRESVIWTTYSGEPGEPG